MRQELVFDGFSFEFMGLCAAGLAGSGGGLGLVSGCFADGFANFCLGNSFQAKRRAAACPGRCVASGMKGG